MSETLLVCPTHRGSARARSRGASHVERVHTIEYASHALDALTAPCRQAVGPIETPCDALAAARSVAAAHDVEAVITTDDHPGTMLAAILADDFSLPGPAAPRNRALPT